MGRRSLPPVAIGVMAALAAAGCGSTSAECAGVRDVGILLAVTDADTGEPICDAAVHLEHPGHSEELTAEGPDPCRYLGGNVTGSYSVSISRTGYTATSLSVEVADGGDCGVETQEIEVRLEPTSS
jgi:hypothetical protein